MLIPVSPGPYSKSMLPSSFLSGEFGCHYIYWTVGDQLQYFQNWLYIKPSPWPINVTLALYLASD
jgi:hypothetical protein